MGGCKYIVDWARFCLDFLNVHARVRLAVCTC